MSRAGSSAPGATRARCAPLASPDGTGSRPRSGCRHTRADTPKSPRSTQAVATWRAAASWVCRATRPGGGVRGLLAQGSLPCGMRPWAAYDHVHARVGKLAKPAPLKGAARKSLRVRVPPRVLAHSLLVCGLAGAARALSRGCAAATVCLRIRTGAELMMDNSAHAYRGVRRLHARSRLLRLQPDERLVGLVRAGHMAAFEVLVARYERRLFAFCRHLLGRTEDAEDVLQE